MLSSIHPLGERARSNQWAVTVSAFSLGAILGGAGLGVLASVAGAVAGLPSMSVFIPLASMMLAGVADLAGIAPPGPHRQVNERWIGEYRGWVYGSAFGLQLGLGFTTYVVTWTVPAMVVMLAWIGDLSTGLVIGALFGLGRAIPLIAAGWITTPDRMTMFNRRLIALGGPTRMFVSSTIVLVVVFAATTVERV
jgi:hypothetical protein